MIKRTTFNVLLWLLLESSLLAQSSVSSAFKSANSPGAVGETGSLYLLEEGFFARPFYNDVFGHTDKQLSGASQLGYLNSWRDSSLESRTHWLLITPTFKEKFGDEALVNPVGRYADWMELQESWAKLTPLGGELTRVQISIGYGHVGNHGGKQVHRSFHKMIGSSLLGLDYSDQPEGPELSGGFEFGIIDQPRMVWGAKKESMLNIGFHRNKFMTDLYLNQNHVFTLQENTRLGLEMRLIRQADSTVYQGQHLAWRFELAFGLRYGWYRPSLKYVSNYLRNDHVGQLYFDPLAVYFAL